MALLLLLPGCWFGGNFYTNADLVSAVPPGDYQAVRPERRSLHPDILRISVRADGLTRVAKIGPDGREDGGDVFLVGFAPMDASGRLSVAWLTREGSRPAQAEGQVFLLLRRDDAGFSVLALPCNSSTADAVRQAGGRVTVSRPDDVCEFDDRVSLEAAVRAVEPTLPIWLQLEPITAP